MMDRERPPESTEGERPEEAPDLHTPLEGETALTPEREAAAGERPHEREDAERREEIRDQLASLPETPPPPEQLERQTPTAERLRPTGALEALQRDRLDVLATNARHILGPDAADSEVAALAHRTFREYARAIAFSARPRSRKKLREMTDVVGEENFRDAIAKQGRAIVVTSHMAYFPTGMKMIPEFLPATARGTALVEKDLVWRVVNAARRVASLFRRQRTEQPRFEMMVKDSTNPKTLVSLLHRLKAGDPNGQQEVFFIAGDRGDLSPDRRQTNVRFFDTEVNFPTGPATIGRLAEAPLLPATITREGDRFSVNIGEPITIDADADEHAALQDATQRLADFFAEAIRQHPEQWPVYRHDYWPEQRDFRP